jgi:hypothetical protein
VFSLGFTEDHKLSGRENVAKAALKQSSREATILLYATALDKILRVYTQCPIYESRANVLKSIQLNNFRFIPFKD